MATVQPQFPFNKMGDSSNKYLYEKNIGGLFKSLNFEGIPNRSIHLDAI